MLARLDQDLAPLRFSVDREGALLRAQAEENLPEDLTARVSAVVEEMGFFAVALADTPPEIPRWFGFAAVDELSQEEASVLARRWIDELEAEDVIAEPRRLIETLQAVLLDTFRSAARTGMVGTPHIDETALLVVLDGSEAEAVRRWLERKLIGPVLGEPDPEGRKRDDE